MNHFPVSHALISEAASEARIEQMVDEWFAKAAAERTKRASSSRKGEQAPRKHVKHLAFE